MVWVEACLRMDTKTTKGMDRVQMSQDLTALNDGGAVAEGHLRAAIEGGGCGTFEWHFASRMIHWIDPISWPTSGKRSIWWLRGVARSDHISTPDLSYAAQYLACALPCERFTSALADNPCITRGRYGSLHLHRDGLPPSTFCRSPGAPVHSIRSGSAPCPAQGLAASSDIRAISLEASSPGVGIA